MYFCSDYVYFVCGVSFDSNFICIFLCFGDIVMFGSEDRFVVEGSVLKDIFLFFRVKCFLVVFYFESGWEVFFRIFLFYLMEVLEFMVKELE